MVDHHRHHDLTINDLVHEVRALRETIKRVERKLEFEEKQAFTATEVLQYFGLPSAGQRTRKVTAWYRKGFLNKLHGERPRLYDGDEVRALKEAWRSGRIRLDCD